MSDGWFKNYMPGCVDTAASPGPTTVTVPVYYNIGAGSFSQPGWVNVDLPSAHYGPQQRVDIAHDLMSLADLPIETASADIVYCSHVIEHVTNAAVAKLLREAYRVLKPGGGLRLVTPDIELAHRNWQRGDREFFGPAAVHIGGGQCMPNASCTQLWLHSFAGQLAVIDEDATAARKFQDDEIEGVFASNATTNALDWFTGLARFNPERPDNHINWFDDAKLIGMVRAAGFETAYRSGVGQSLYPAMRNARVFDPHFAISLYVEAVR